MKAIIIILMLANSSWALTSTPSPTRTPTPTITPVVVNGCCSCFLGCQDVAAGANCPVGCIYRAANGCNIASCVPYTPTRTPSNTRTPTITKSPTPVQTPTRTQTMTPTKTFTPSLETSCCSCPGTAPGCMSPPCDPGCTLVLNAACVPRN